MECTHKNKVYSAVFLLTNPPQRQWICSNCLHLSEYEYIKSPLDNNTEFNKLYKEKLAKEKLNANDRKS